MLIFAHWQRLIVFVLHYLPERHREGNSHVCDEALQQSKKSDCVRSNNTAELMCENRAAVKVWIIIWGEGNENIQGSKRKGIDFMICFSVSWVSNLWSAAMTVIRGQQEYPICFFTRILLTEDLMGFVNTAEALTHFCFNWCNSSRLWRQTKRPTANIVNHLTCLNQLTSGLTRVSKEIHKQTESEKSCRIHIHFVLSWCSQWVKAAAELYIISYAGGMIHKHISSLMRRLWKLLMSALRAFCGHHQESHVEVHEGALYLKSTHR